MADAVDAGACDLSQPEEVGDGRSSTDDELSAAIGDCESELVDVVVSLGRTNFDF